MSISKSLFIFVALVAAQLANADSGNLGAIKHNPPDDKTIKNSVPPDPYGEFSYTIAAINGQSVPPDPYDVVNGKSVPPDPYGVLNSQAIIKHNPPGYGPMIAGMISLNSSAC